MDDKGVYAVARSVWNNPMFADEEYTQREAWLWLIGAAAWNKRSIRGPRGPLTLQRGEFMFSLRFLEERWGWKKSRVERFLKMLENRDAIRDEKRDGAQVYSIIKYNEFQVVGLPKRDGKRDTNRDESGTASGQQRDKEETLETLEERKISKETPSAPPKPVVVSNLPSWLPLDAWSAFLDMRRKKKAAPTPHAVDLLLKDLDEWRQLGHDPTEILNYSTKGNYTGIFEPKADKNGQRQAKTARGHDSHFAAAASLIGEYLDDGRAGESDSDAAVGASGRPLLPP